jgi:hypothetical protein
MSEQSAPRSQKVGRGKAESTIALGRDARDILYRSPDTMTLRQLYYALISAGAIPKVETQYARLKTVMRDLREDGTVPWDWLVDHTRPVFEARTFDSIEGLLADSANLYRRDLMRQQEVAIQLWAESDSIGSVIARTANRYCISTFIGRGYSARGYLWDAAKDAVAANRAGKKVHILHVGDFDPSGEDIYRDVEETLRLYATTIQWAAGPAFPGTRAGSVADVRRSLRADADTYGGTLMEHLRDWTGWLVCERLALTAAQVEEYDLPTRPPKASDVRTAGWSGAGAVEVEALPVAALLEIVENAILERIDIAALAIAETAEKSERDIARRIAATPIARLIEASA